MAKKKETNGVSLETKITWYENSAFACLDARTLSERDRDYVDNKQWTAAEEAILKKRKQPVVTNNRMAAKLEFLCGLEQQHRTDPKAFARTPQHEKDADAIGDAIRYVMDNNDSGFLLSDTFRELMVEGAEGAEVIVDRESKELDVKINWVRWDRLFWDHHSRNSDFIDAKFYGQFLWMDESEALEKWPNAGKILSEGTETGGADTTYDDAPRIKWGDEKRKRVRIVEMHYLHKNEWWRSVFCKGGELEPDAVSAYKDCDGNSVSSLVLQSCYCDREGNRYGAMRVYVSPQDSVNKRESKMVHLLNVRQTFGNQQSVENPAAVKRELAKPDGHVELRAGAQFGIDFGVIPTGDLAAGQFQLLQEGKAQIDQAGVNAVLQGNDGQVMSGRAREQINQGAMTQSLPLLDPHRRFKLNIYRQAWYRIKQFWTAEKWLRVTDDEDNVKFVGLNQKVTLRQQLEAEGEEIPPEMANDPRLDQVVEVKNDVSRIDVDILIDEVPDTITIQSEQFTVIAEMYKANPKSAQNPDGIPFEMVIEASSLRNKEKLLKKEGGEGGEQGPSPKEQEMAQVIEQLQTQMQQMQQEAQAQIEQMAQEKAALEQKLNDKQAEIHVRASEVDSKEDIAMAQIEQKAQAESDKAAVEIMKLEHQKMMDQMSMRMEHMEKVISCLMPQVEAQEIVDI